ncbi:restriction endonuclease subunit S [Gordonia westfalica]|uniref:Type I restriction enzyme, S subunit n=1 Tax=Gordonia westfalica TaxID=158898 RepID=A0A1H2HC09_9ACTN|nr:restriction endonuclease subunit S [Gordonia westfalica]SDU29332.1 type I restriction enzyme, S subunit [Gordonia westfalica]
MTGPLWAALPGGWLTGQLKNAATVTLGKMLQSKDSGDDVRAPYMRAANVQPDGVLALDDVNEMWFGAAELEQLSIRAGDVVVVEGGQGGFGRAAYVDEGLPGWGFQNSINRLRPTEDFDGRFIAFYLIALRASGFIRAYSNVVSMPHLTAEKLARIPMPLPPLDEQRAIADYLDRETARIDTLIEEQQRLIEMLRERRQAIVESAVGRGLDQTASMRASGLFWTDQVPQHWAVANIRKVATMKTGHTPSRSKPEYWVDCTIPWFTLADVWQLRDGRRTYLGETTNLISEVGLANSAAELLPAGTVVLSRTASVGFSGIMPVEMATSQDFWNWIPGDRLTAEYLMWTFRAMRSEIQSLMIGSTHKTIYQPTAAAFRVPVPPIAEQRGIAAYLDDQTNKIDTLITESERLIELSKERRSALITAAVTGQIDVREMV